LSGAAAALAPAKAAIRAVTATTNDALLITA
jgi:hypothetical protein